MKTKITHGKTFHPVSITITFETQKELDVFGTMCNCAPIHDTVANLGGKLPDYDTLSKVGSDINNVEVFIDELCAQYAIRRGCKVVK